ncbi:hypothetical protein K1719_025192 [Acacia pycnantha]|nr:hypothetical protein K1719_025192 [Acacia pycnantha]
MARKWGWFSAVKKAIVGFADNKKDQKNNKLKTTWPAEPADLEPAQSSKEEPTFDVAPPPPSIGTDQEEINEQIIKQAAYSVDDDDDATSAVAAADVVIADDAQAPEEVVQPASPPHYLEKTKEEIAAINIQTAFRGFLARRALHSLRRLMRLKTSLQGHCMKQQAAESLRCMRTIAKEQSQVRERRIRMSEENQSLQRQLQGKHEKELNKPQTIGGEDWDDSTKSKKEIEARVLDRKSAAMRREKARTYSSIHQQTWRKQQASKSGNRRTMNPDWSWRWGERWMGSRPWDERCGGSDGDGRRAQKPSRPPTPTQHQRRHSISGLSVRDDEDSRGSSGMAKYSVAAPKLSALSPDTNTCPSASASKRHSCPPHILNHS